MPFSPVDVPIQEMLQSDFIVDLAQIHNTNVLLLKTSWKMSLTH